MIIPSPVRLPDSVLLIPGGGGDGDGTMDDGRLPLSAYAIEPGYYNAEQLLELIDAHANEPEAIQFIADTLSTGNPKYDGWARLIVYMKDDAARLQQAVNDVRRGMNLHHHDNQTTASLVLPS